MIQSNIQNGHHEGSIRVIVNDDHEIFRTGLRTTFKQHPEKKIEIVAEIINGTELMEEVESLRPHVVIGNVKMPKMDCKEVYFQIKQKFSDTGIIAISPFEDEKLACDLFQLGINAFLLKRADKQEIIQAIQTVALGETYYSTNVSKFLIRQLVNRRRRLQKKNIWFSHRELTIMKLICKQLTTRRIAEELGLSIRTVEEYRKNIKEKTGTTNTVGMVLYAIKNGIVNIDEL